MSHLEQRGAVELRALGLHEDDQAALLLAVLAHAEHVEALLRGREVDDPGGENALGIDLL